MSAGNSLEASEVLVEKEQHTPITESKQDGVEGEEETRAETAGANIKSLRGSHIIALALRRLLKGPAPTLDHIIRFLSSGSGHDKFWMVSSHCFFVYADAFHMLLKLFIYCVCCCS